MTKKDIIMERCIENLHFHYPEMNDLIDQLDILYHQDSNLSKANIQQLVKK